MGFLKNIKVYSALEILVISCICVSIVSASDSNKGTGQENVEVSDKVKILYHGGNFKEIIPGSYGVIDNENVTLSVECVSTNETRTNSTVDWIYHGTKEADLHWTRKDDTISFENFTSGPSVFRLECFDFEYDRSLSISTNIYSGDGNPPFLSTHGRSASVEVLNETTVRFPCILNYPLGATNEHELQLFKDEVQIENLTSGLSYSPEFSYILDVTKFKEPFGNYECRVSNSTADDFVKIKLQEDDIDRTLLKITEPRKDFFIYYENEPTLENFVCTASKLKFSNKFSWSLLWKNGSYTPLEPENITPPETDSTSAVYGDWVKFKFPSVDITHVVCAGVLKDNATNYNVTRAVTVKVPIEPKIVTTQLDGPIAYQKGENLTCSTEGYPVEFKWFKDGKALMEDIIFYEESKMHSSTISLDPLVENASSNYTCQVSNSLGTDKFSYQVMVPENKT